MSSLVSRASTAEQRKTLMTYQKTMGQKERNMLRRHRLLCRRLRNHRQNEKFFGIKEAGYKSSRRVEKHQERMFEAGIPAEVIHAHYESHGRGWYNHF